MAWSHEGATDKINNLKQEKGWKPGKARRFHDWLASAYPSEKDTMSLQDLRRVANEFEAQDTDRWND